jgi:hypothetical protein
MRLVWTIAASSLAALVVFRALYPYQSLYPLADGAVIGGILFAAAKVLELGMKRRLPMWGIAPAAAVVTGVVYWAWHLVLMM